MSARFSKVQSQILSSSNPHEEIRLKKISDKIKKKLLEHHTDYSTTITNNGSNLKLNISTIKHELIALPKLNTQKIAAKPKPIIQSIIF